MKRLFILLACSVLLNSAAFAQGTQGTAPTLNGGQSPTQGCSAAHQDQAVNVQVTLTIPASPVAEQFVYICGWDWQVSEDTTGSVQTNVLWTTVNLGNPAVKAGYSVAAAPNAIVSGNFTYPSPIRANTPGAVIFQSPAAVAHNSYSLNVYYRYAN